MSFLGLKIFTWISLAVVAYIMARSYFKGDSVAVKDLSPEAEKWKTIITQIMSALLIIAGFGAIGQIPFVAKLLAGMDYVVANYDSAYEVIIRAIDLVVGLGLVFGFGKKREEEVVAIQSMGK